MLAEKLRARVEVLEMALMEIKRGAENQSAHAGMSWRDVRKICNKALGIDK